MKSNHIRILVVLAIATLIGIISTQVYWLAKAIDQQDQVFNHNVHLALRNVVESLCETSGKDYPVVDPIERVSNNYYLVKTNDQINISNLEYLITAEISKRAITQDFDYGVYDCLNDEMVFAENVNLEKEKSRNTLPTLENQEYYFGVYFPNKPQSILAELDLWKFTTLLTGVIILFFGYALFVILRQKKLSEIQKDFINNVTHELRTPLATLALASETLVHKTESSSMKYVDIIRSEVIRLQSNVEWILKASIAENHRKITKEAVDVEAFIWKLVEEYKLQYSSLMVTWKIAGSANRRVNIDRSIVEQAMRNLLDNAIKYGGKMVEVSLDQDQRHTRIRIRDDGKGIEKKYHSKIFTKFFRVPEEDHQHNEKGFGLGLFIVKSSLKRMKAKISVDTKGNEKGISFLISIPNG